MSKDEFSGAGIKAICTEAGLLALREQRMKVTHADFKKAKEKVMLRRKKACCRASICRLISSARSLSERTGVCNLLKWSENVCLQHFFFWKHTTQTTRLLSRDGMPDSTLKHSSMQGKAKSTRSTRSLGTLIGRLMS